MSQWHLAEALPSATAGGTCVSRRRQSGGARERPGAWQWGGARERDQELGNAAGGGERDQELSRRAAKFGLLINPRHPPPYSAAWASGTCERLGGVACVRCGQQSGGGGRERDQELGRRAASLLGIILGKDVDLLLHCAQCVVRRLARLYQGLPR